MNDPIPIPFEVEYPEVAEQLKQIANRNHPAIRMVNFTMAGNLYVMNDKSHRIFRRERNDKCSCGSGKKFKNCHG